MCDCGTAFLHSCLLQESMESSGAGRHRAEKALHHWPSAMPVAVSGKRPFLEDPSGTSPNMKKVRRGSPPVCLPSEAVSAFGNEGTSHDQEQRLVELQYLFPNINGQTLKDVLASCGYDLHCTIERLTALPSTSQASPLEYCRVDPNHVVTTKDGREWVELVVREVVSASDMADARVKATSALEAFEKATTLRAGSTIEVLQKENAVMKEQVQGLLRDNHVLRRAVAIQHDRRQGEHENWSREMEQLKQLLSNQQEHVKALELSNYALNVHLRRFEAGTTSAIMERFHPDVF